MSASNVARRRETLCVECGEETDGGRYCDVCLPKNQTEQEEAYDREHPIGTFRQETVICPKSECLKELHNNTPRGLRQSLYNHLSTTHLNEYSSKREISLAAEALVPTGGTDLAEAAAEWDEKLDEIRKSLIVGIQEGNERMKKDGNGEGVVPRQDSMVSVSCPVDGCGKVSHGSDMPRLKASLDAHMRGKHGEMSSKGRLALTNMALPGVPWPRKKDKSSGASDKQGQDLTADVRQQEKENIKPETVQCPCGATLTKSSPKTKLRNLVASHVKGSVKHRGMSEVERIALCKQLLPGLRWLGPVTGAERVQKEQPQMEKVSAHTPAAFSETQLFLYDNTNGASVKLPLGGLTDILRELVSGQKCRVLITKQDKMTRAVIEIPEEQI